MAIIKYVVCHPYVEIQLLNKGVKIAPDKPLKLNAILVAIPCFSTNQLVMITVNGTMPYIEIPTPLIIPSM